MSEAGSWEGLRTAAAVERLAVARGEEEMKCTHEAWKTAAATLGLGEVVVEWQEAKC